MRPLDVVGSLLWGRLHQGLELGQDLGTSAVVVGDDELVTVAQTHSGLPRGHGAVHGLRGVWPGGLGSVQGSGHRGPGRGGRLAEFNTLENPESRTVSGTVESCQSNREVLNRGRT